MGVFKQIKDMKNLGQSTLDAHELTADTLDPLQDATRSPDPDFEPIASVSIELYARISRRLAATQRDQAPDVVTETGISADDWAIASAGWNARMESNPAVGARFGSLYAAS